MPTFTDFSPNLNRDIYLRPTHHDRLELVGSTTDTPRTAPSVQTDNFLKEITNSLIAGHGVKLPNSQVILYRQLDTLLNLSTVQTPLKDAIQAVYDVYGTFLTHTSFENVLNRLGTTLSEISNIADMINFGANEIDPVPITKLLETTMKSFLGDGQKINELIGTINFDLVDCELEELQLDEFQSNLFTSGFLAVIAQHYDDVTNGTVSNQILNSLQAQANLIVNEVETLINCENNINTTHDMGGSVFDDVCEDIHTGVGVFHNPTSLQQNSRLASQLKSLYDSLGSYQVVDCDGTVYNNIFETFVENGVLDLLKRASNPISEISETEPIRNCMGEIIEYRDIVIQKPPEKSVGQSPPIVNLPGFKGGGINVEPVTNTTSTPSITSPNFTRRDFYNLARYVLVPGNNIEIERNPGDNTLTFNTDATDTTDTTDTSTEVTISDDAPDNPNDGALWVDSTNFNLSVYFDDGNSSQWVGIRNPFELDFSLTANDIPDLDADKIASGIFDTARLATGGSVGQVLKRTSSGMEWADDEVGAPGSGEANVQVDWNEASTNSDAYIKNKPDIPDDDDIDDRVATWARRFSPSGTIPDASISSSIARDSDIPSDTDDLSEGSTNLYFTDTRADNRIATWARANSPSGTIPDATIPSSIARDSEIPSDTDALSEGSTNLYFTNERVDDRVNALLTQGTGITLTYDDTANTLTIARDSLSASDIPDLDADKITSGEFDTTRLATGGTDGQVLTRTASGMAWENATGGSGGASVTLADEAPTNPDDGELWIDTDSLKLFAYYNDGDSSQWVGIRSPVETTFETTEGTSGNAAISLGDNPPSSPDDGELWIDTTNLELFVYYNDGDSSQWVGVKNPLQSSSESSSDGGNAAISLGDNPPSNPNDGELWVDTTNLELFVYYNDGDSSQWVNIRNPVEADSLSASDIPDLDADKITTGIFDTTRLATGGSVGQVLKRTSSGMEWADDEVGAPGSGEENVQSNWDETNTSSDAFIQNKPDIPDNTDIDGRIATWARANSPSGTIPDANIPSSIARDSEIPNNTDSLSEGSTNLYFTNTRADNRIATWARANSPSGTIPDASIPSSIARDSEIPSDTDNLSEGSTNLYFTNERVDDRINALLTQGTGITLTYDDTANTLTIASTGIENLNSFDTDDLSEGSSNLYFTNSRADNRIASWARANSPSGTIPDATIPSSIARDSEIPSNTDSLSEGSTNLYFTNTRADNRIATWARANSPSGTIPDANIPSSIARDSEIPSSTTNLSEGTNLYFTNERVDDRVNALLTQGTGITLTYDDAAGTLTVTRNTLTTSDIPDLDADKITSGIFDTTRLATGGTDGQILTRTASGMAWEDAAESGNASVTLADIAPTNPDDGELWIDTTSLKLFAYYNDGDSSQWVGIISGGGISSSSSTELTDNSVTLDHLQHGTDGQFLAYGTGGAPERRRLEDGDIPSSIARDSEIPSDTDALSEGSSNLYFTDTRADNRIATWARANSPSGTIPDATIPSSIARDSEIPSSTTNLSEGTNLYFTNERVDDRVNALLIQGTGITLTYDDTAGTLTVTRNTLSVADIPALAASKITSGIFDTTRLAAGGSAGQVLKRTSSGMEWADDEVGSPGSGEENVQSDWDETNTSSDAFIQNKPDIPDNTDIDGRIATWARVNSPSGTIPDANIPSSIARDTEIPSDTDSLSEGSSNLYFTNTRADSRVATWARANSPSGTIPDARIPSSIARDSEIPSSTTTLTEGTNLYFTNERVDDRVNALLTQGAGITLTYNDASNTLTIASAGIENLNSFDTDDLSEGGTNLYFTNTRADNRIASWARANSPSGTIPDANIPSSIARDSEIPSNTDSLSEGSTNLYFTNERVDDRVNALLTQGTGITLTYNDSSNTLTIARNALTASDIPDLDAAKITSGTFDTTRLATGGSTGQVLKRTSSGMEWADDEVGSPGSGEENVQSNWDETNTNSDAFIQNKPDIPDNTNIDGRIATWARANSPSGTIPDANIPSSIARDSEIPSDTDSLSEGSTNLYFTNTRADNRIATWARANSPSGTIPDATIPSSIARDSEIPSSTTNLSEGTNLYFTNERVDDRVNALLTQGTGITLTYDDTANTLTIASAGIENLNSFDTDALSEGSSNLYFTNSRADNRIASWARANSPSGTIPDATIPSSIARDSEIPSNTDSLSEGSTNLYFTNTRADNRISTWARANSPSGTIPDARIPSSIARDSEIPSNTDSLSEGSTNLYFTNERVDDRVNALLTQGTGITLTYNDSSNTLTIASTVSAGISASDLETWWDDFDVLISTSSSGFQIALESDEGTLQEARISPQNFGNVLGRISGSNGQVLTKDGNAVEWSTITSYTDEKVDDRVNALLTQGTGITLTYDDTANTLTIARNALTASDIPDLDAAKITSGEFDTTRLATGGTDGQVLTRTAAGMAWENTAGGNAAISLGDSPPSSPDDGALWVDTTNLELFVYYNDGDTSQWVGIRNPLQSSGSNSNGGNAAISLGDNPPSSPNDGELWVNTDSLELFVYYNDGDSSQWVNIRNPVEADSLSASDIPNLSASKITSGIFDTTRLASDGTDGQVLTRTADGMAWEDATGGGTTPGTAQSFGTYTFSIYGTRNASEDFETLSAAGNSDPIGMWANDTTMWIADDADGVLYAYNLSDKSRDSSEDFETLNAAGNGAPRGIWSDGTTMWVADRNNSKIFAYNMSDKARNASEDFDTLSAAGNNGAENIWSDGTTMWVADGSEDKIFAYNLSTKARDSSEDFDTLDAASNNFPRGIWSDGTTMFVSDSQDFKVYAYNMSDKARNASKDIETLDAANNNNIRGTYGIGHILYVSDNADDKIYAYNISEGVSVNAHNVTRITEGTNTLTVTFANRLDDQDTAILNNSGSTKATVTSLDDAELIINTDGQTTGDISFVVY